jgi:hypothetical protein
VVEGFERLTLAFAEHRCWPENASIKAKTLVYAGIVSHYAADMQQPLHTTVHYDGRTDKDGHSPRSGVHVLVDGLFENAGFEIPTSTGEAVDLDDIQADVRRQFSHSHAFVDTVYALEPALNKLAKEQVWSPELRDFAAERWTASRGFLSAIFANAWKKSAQIEFDDWIQRAGGDGEFSTCAVKLKTEVNPQK